MNAPTDSQGRVLSTFKLTMAEFIDDLLDITAFDTVEVTHDYEDPTKVLLKFHIAEGSGDCWVAVPHVSKSSVLVQLSHLPLSR